MKVRGRLAIFEGPFLQPTVQFGSSLDLQLGDRPLVRVLVTLQLLLMTSLQAESRGELRSAAHHRILFLEPGPLDY
jgi:hypothetical protein